MAEQTTNLGLSKPNIGEAGWGEALNNNFDKLDLAAAKSAVRQTVLSGRIDAGGHAKFLEAGAGLGVNLMASEAPLAVTFASGFSSHGAIDYFSRIEQDILNAWVVPANKTSFLYLELDPITGAVSRGFSDSAPIYQSVSPSLTRADLTQAMASYVGGDGTVSASSELNGEYAAWKAFDKTSDAVYGWASNGTTQGWIQFLFNSAKVAGAYSIQSRTGDGNAPSQTPSAWVFKGSNNGVDWVVLDAQENQTAWAQGETRTYEFPNAESYTHYRLDVSAVNGSNLISIGELRILSAPGADQHWFDPSSMIMWVWDGSQWVQKQRVFVGEAASNGESVTSVISYAIRGRYESGRFALSVSTAHAKNHNLGCMPRFVVARGAATAGGDLSEFSNIFGGTSSAYYGAWLQDIGRNSVKLVTGNDTSGWHAQLGASPFYSKGIEAEISVERGW